MNYFAVLMRFLRDRTAFLEDIRNGKRLQKTITALLICSSVFFAFYGAIMGSYSGGLQMIASALKLPALYLITLLICLPSLFFFDIVAGSKRTFAQYLALLLSAMAAMSVMLFGFAPITLFFRLSISDYIFFQFLNLFVLAATGIVGVHFFYRGMLYLDEHDAEKPQYRLTILKSWLVLYGFVGSQLGWTLRPFFGAPGMEFQFFRQLESNFYLQVIRMIGNVLGVN
ncbi:MAG: actin-binding WH2 domain-containing protein [Spirulinaceae cyanobacterium]